MVLLWRIRSRFEDWYFHKKYSNKGPKIYYDRRFKCYVHSGNTIERGPFEYVVAELIRDNIIYSYYVKGKLGHDHYFEKVMKRAYYEAEDFEICLEYNEYNQRQIDIIKKIQLLSVQEKNRASK